MIDTLFGVCDPKHPIHPDLGPARPECKKGTFQNQSCAWPNYRYKLCAQCLGDKLHPVNEVLVRSEVACFCSLKFILPMYCTVRVLLVSYEGLEIVHVKFGVRRAKNQNQIQLLGGCWW